jgi:hypothetical protein
VKEARDPLLQLSRMTRLTHGNRVVEEIPLNLRRQIIPRMVDQRNNSKGYRRIGLSGSGKTQRPA